MQDHENADPIAFKRVPWNKGKLIGAKPPLRPKHVWSIRTKLQIEGAVAHFAGRDRRAGRGAGVEADVVPGTIRTLRRELNKTVKAKARRRNLTIFPLTTDKLAARFA